LGPVSTSRGRASLRRRPSCSNLPGPFPFAAFGTLEGRFPGSTALFNDTINGRTVLTKDGGGVFSIQSIALANLNAPGTVSVEFEGTRGDASVITQTLTFDSFKSLTAFAFDPGFSNLVTLAWVQESPLHQFDNLVVDQPVPEPGTMLLLGGGITTLALPALALDVLQVT
jgi:hypothetical protein